MSKAERRPRRTKEERAEARLERLREAAHLRAMPYAEYLRTDHWLTLRQRVLKRYKHRCQLCGNGSWLEVHHRSYENLGAEKWADVVLLCSRCHRRFHRGPEA